MYSLGCILNECWTRRQPWGREHDHFCQIIMQVAIYGERPRMDPEMPAPLRRLVSRCWDQVP